MTTELPEDRVDLGPLAADMEVRAARVVEHVLRRVREAAINADRPVDLLEAVQRQIARFVIPGAVLAAASIAMLLLTRNAKPPAADRFALVALGANPVTRWLARGTPPDIAELARVVEDAR